MKSFVAALIILGLFSPAIASPLSGVEVIDACEHFVASDASHQDQFKQGLCVGISIGVYYKEQDLCLPSEVNTDQIVRVVTHYMSEHPENLNLSAAGLANIAIKQAWPCRAPSSR